MGFKELVEEIKRQKKFANDDLSDVTPQTRIPREGRKRSAKAKLEELFFQYRNEVRGRILAILVFGEEVDKFGELAKNSDAKLDSVEGDILYSTLAEKLDPRLLASPTSSSYVLDVASRHLEDVALDIGIREYNQLIYKAKYQQTVKTKEQAKELIQEAILEQIGGEINALAILDAASRAAYEEVFDGKFFPIMVKVRDKKILQELTKALPSLKAKVIVVSTGSSKVEDSIKVKEVSEESVIETLKKVKQKASKSQ